MNIEARKHGAGGRLRRDKAVDALTGEAVPPRGRRAPVKSFRSWIFTVMFLGLIGLLLGVMLGGVISA